MHVRVLPNIQDLPLDDASPKRSRLKPRWRVLGFLYLCISLGLNIYYVVAVVERNVSNDYYWPGFNSTGLHTFLGDIFNGKLPLVGYATDGAVLSLNASLAILKSYATEDTFIDGNPSAARAAMINIPLDQAVTALRSTSFDATIAISPYCWVDLNRSFGLAITAARQRRCELRDMDNAAVYFELPLRNADARTSNFFNYFKATMFSPLQTTATGRLWLETLPSLLPLEDEVTAWRVAGLARWTTQMHNAWQIGMQETISIVNALNFAYQIDINIMPDILQSAIGWTTSKAWFGMANGAYMCAFLNCSVVRGMTNSIDRMPFDWDTQVVVGPSAVTPVEALVRQHIGPYGVIDIRFVTPPTELLEAVLDFQTVVFPDLQRLSHISNFIRTTSANVDPIPPSWTSMVYYGGNPMCLFRTPQPYPQPSFSFGDSCGPQVADSITLGPISSLFAIMATGTLDSIRMLSMCSLCTSHATQNTCLQSLQLAASLYDTLLDKPSMSVVVTAKLLALNVTTVQFATTANSTTLVLLVQPMLRALDDWTFFGWITMYEWAVGTREVYMFEGDVGSVTTISPSQPFVELPANPLELPHRASYYVLYIIIYTAVVFSIVGLLVLVVGVWHRFQVNGRTLFYFNRVVGSVWIGRPCLLVRGVMAIVILSTSNVVFTSTSGFSQLQMQPRSWMEILLLAGEASWLCYAATDLVLPVKLSQAHAPLCCLVSSLVVVLWEGTSSCQLTLAVERSCRVSAVGLQIYCHGGNVSIGNFSRLQGLVLIHIVCFCGSVVATQAYTTWRKSPQSVEHVSHLLLPASADAFLAAIAHADSQGLDSVTCIMSGMLPFRDCLFDLKLWGFIHLPSDVTSTSFVFPTPKFNQKIASFGMDQHAHTTWIRLSAVVGLVYIVGTVIGSYVFIRLTRSTMANDYWWDTFNSSGTQAFMVNWYNFNLQTVRSTAPFRIDGVDQGDSRRVYNTSLTDVVNSALYVTTLQDEANTLTNVIAGLRNMDGCVVPWIFTPYCFVDLARQWELANSIARQRRCYAHETTNGAVYLELVIRNADWTRLQQCWGSSFERGIFSTLGQTMAGQVWMASMNQASLSVAREVSYWQTHGISYYTTHWQTFKLLGVVEHILIQNAFGIAYAMTLKRMSTTMQLAAQTTYKMYWGLANDLLTIGANDSSIAALSLIRHSHQYAFENTSLENIFIETHVLASPLSPGLALVRATLGPFGTLDIKRTRVPTPLAMLFRTLTKTVHIVLATMDSTITDLYLKLTATTVFVAKPIAWDAAQLVGGDLFCELKSQSGNDVAEFFLPHGSCGEVTLNQLFATRENLIKAFLAANLLNANATQITAICARETRNQPACLRTLAILQAVLQPLDWPTITSLVLASKHGVRDILKVEMLQFMKQPGGVLSLSRLNLFAPTEVEYEFWAWMYVFDWVQGIRQVISVQGEFGTLTTISGVELPRSQVSNPLEIHYTEAYYVRCALQYVTILLLVLAAFVVFYILALRGDVEMWNMVEFNRVAGMVWVGRPLVLLRGIAAIGLLSTARLQLIQSENGLLTYFTSPHRPWYTVFMSCGEMCWLVYILNDTFSPLTRQYTYGYATKSSISTWLVTFIWSMLSPVQHHVTMARQCTVVEVDFELVCSSGTMAIGSLARFGGLIGLAMACCVLSYAFERIYDPKTQYQLTDHSLMLHATARNCLDFERWHHRGVVYIDKASAVLTGLLTLQWGNEIFIFDIKSWRRYTFNVATLHNWTLMDLDDKKFLVYAIPLVE
ncbi:Aste57867_20241 [Aphanomyces stellatus]|uniref:Aste57867_20241 protein n=1 Tax=Aphanomyces stellatus TaxID=120398 RepID=A0A485LEP0_9STRA|nr:hypothetical protein As57867_020175 [Aphanomyces stellatus]VFT96932.1 Aste57867_20241 [Aphanomyces stellatus]